MHIVYMYDSLISRLFNIEKIGEPGDKGYMHTVLLTMCLRMVPYWENCSRMKEAAVDGKPKTVTQQSW